MAITFPSKMFFGFVSLLLLGLLGGYLYLADVIPEDSPKPRQVANAAPSRPVAPEQDPGNWKEYRDRDLQFSVRYPAAWAPRVLVGAPYEVRFSPPEAGLTPPYALSIKVHSKDTFQTVLASARRESMNGLFPPVGSPTVALGSTEWPIFENYTSPDSSFVLSKAILEHDNNVYEFKLERQREAPEIPGMFNIWLRSFGL